MQAFYKRLFQVPTVMKDFKIHQTLHLHWIKQFFFEKGSLKETKKGTLIYNE